MAQAPDLFVVCSSCQNEVSPYITECPYCGNRLRKRAPNIGRDGTVEETPTRRPRGAVAKPPKPPKVQRERRVPRGRRRGPKAAPSPYDTQRPWGTIVIVALSIFGGFALAVGTAADLALTGGALSSQLWRLPLTVFLYDSTWHALAVVGPIALFGWLLERRHGAWVPVLLFVVCGMGGAALASAVEGGYIFGAGGAALGMLCAWAVPDLRRQRNGEEHDADLIGVAVIAAVILLLPLGVPEVGATAVVAGGLVGLLGGLALAARE